MKLTRKILKIIVLMNLLFMIMVPVNINAEETNNEIKIVCTNSVLADFAKNIVPENTVIDYIQPAGACPAHFDTIPSDVNRIINADVIISLSWEPWLEDLIAKSENTDYTEIKCGGGWNTPPGAIRIIKVITDGLKQAFPEHNATIQENAESYMSQINKTAERLKQKITDHRFDNKKVVSIEWQKDFLEYFGLNVTYHYPPSEGLSVKDQIEVINEASEEEVSAVVDNLQSGTLFGARVASEAGKSHIVLSNFPGAVPDTETYLKNMEYNINQTITGIQNYDYKKDAIIELEKEIEDLKIQRNGLIALAAMLMVLVAILFIMFKRKTNLE